MQKPPLSTRLLLLSLMASPATAQDSFFDGVLDLSNLNGTNGFVINGIAPNDRFGSSVSGAGDINGDGIVDLIIGTSNLSPSSSADPGESYVLFGGLGLGSNGSLGLSSLNGTNGFVINGANAGDSSGRSVANAGDVNGDGFADLIIGSPRADPGDRSDAGESYVLFGGRSIGFGGAIELSSINGTNGFVINGIDTGDQSGSSVSGAGDVNNDGFADLIIGAPFGSMVDDAFAGESYVVFGASQVGSGGSIQLSSLDGANGFSLNRPGLIGELGSSVSRAGDLNRDGFGDLIIGAPFGASARGEGFVVFGGVGVGSSGTVALGSLSGSDGFVLTGSVGDGGAGRSVSNAGDVNGDGFDDLIIGEPAQGGAPGQSYVVFGRAGLGSSGTIDLSTLNGTNGFVVGGIDLGDGSGRAVSAAGDINGDGIGDLIIGAPFADPNANTDAGETYVVFGAPGIGSGGTITASSLNGQNGFVINGIDADGDSGSAVSGIGDVNGDGVDDLILGAPAAGVAVGLLGDRRGESYVIFGASGFTWTPLTGGAFDTASSWLGGVTPGATGVGSVVLAPDFGGAVTGGSSTVVVNRFTLGAIVGTTTFQFGAGDLISRQSITIQSNGRVIGPGSGNVTLATAGELNNAGEIVLGSELSVSAQTIRNSGTLRGAGRLSGVVTNTGRIEVINQAGEMSFTGAVTNDTSGLVVLQSSTARFARGIDNRGQLSVATAGTILGDVTNTGTIGVSGGTTLSLVGDLQQNGTANLLDGSRLTVFGNFTGAGGTTGSGTLEVLGTTSLGNSPAEVGFGGDLILGSDTLIEIGGTGIGEFDRFVVDGTLTLDGDLTVELINGFELSDSQVFEIASVSEVSGGFNGLKEGDVVGTFGGRVLQITYVAGDGNDVALFTAVPEPGSLALLSLGGLIVLGRRRHSSTNDELNH